jgi:hypothetical protein
VQDRLRPTRAGAVAVEILRQFRQQVSLASTFGDGSIVARRQLSRVRSVAVVRHTRGRMRHDPVE